MAELKHNVKHFIVQALACFDTPTQVATAVRAEFGLEISRMQVQKYDPTKAMGKHLSKDLRTLFEETRAKFKAEQDAIPIANQNYRLNVLNRMLVAAESKNNLVLAAQLLEQGAKEIGGAYTNTRRLEGGDPKKPIQVARTPIELTDDALDALLAASLNN